LRSGSPAALLPVLPAGAVAHFQQGSWDLASNTWPNDGSAGGSATLSGMAATLSVQGGKEILALRGVTTSVIDFGDVIASDFTICSATRYSGTAKRRILQGDGANWLHGHHESKAGVAYYAPRNPPASGTHWKTPEANQVTPNTDWVIMCASNAGAQLTLVNGVDVGSGTTGGQGGFALQINKGPAWYGGSPLEPSDFDVAEVITWDRGLTATETRAAHEYLMYKVLGVTPPQLPDLPAGPWAHFRQGGWDAASARLLTGVHVTEGSWSCGEADQVEAVSTLSGDLNEGSGGAFSMAVPSLFLCARWSDTTTTATDLVTRVVTTTGTAPAARRRSARVTPQTPSI